MIAIIDYGMGNLGSIQNMLKKIGAQSVITSDHNIIRGADKLILPGVGAFDKGMAGLLERNLIGVLNEEVLVNGKKILGLCLGMQLITHSSEEGNAVGLGWVNAKTVKFRFDKSETMLRVPHMGWNYLSQAQSHVLFENLTSKPRYYFVHSYYVECAQPDQIIATCSYGTDFAAVIGHKNILGTQFHPEKSHRFGLQLLRNFVEKF